LSTSRHTTIISSLLEEACGGDSSNDFQVSASPYLVVVAAAGNGGDTTKLYPAAEDVDGLIAVAASNSDDRLASFSTRGSWVHVAAPGQGILSTVPNAQYGTWSGTSMATPLVSGEAALVRARFPSLSNKDLARHVREMGQRIDGDVQFRIDAGKALTTSPDGDPLPIPTPSPTPTKSKPKRRS
jgi:thermitase